MKPSVSLLLSIALSFGCFVAHAQTDDEGFVSWAKSNAKPLKDLALDAPDSSWSAIRAAVGTARVVSIGETVHLAAEPLMIRNRIIRLLLEECGFTAIAVESGFLEVAEVDRYLQGGDGSVDQLAQKFFSWGPDSLEQNRELLVWLRARNASGKRPKVHVYGVDPPGVRIGRFPDARIAIDFPISMLARVAPQKAKSTSGLLDPILKRFTDQAYNQLSTAERTTLTEQITALKKQLFENRRQLEKASGRQEFNLALHSLDTAAQLDTLFRLAPKPGSPMAEFAEVGAARDRGMAENVVWALDQTGRNGKVVVFAHNFHVMNAEWAGVFKFPIPMMGTHLKRQLGSRLFAIGVSARESNLFAKAPRTGPSGMGSALSRVGFPLYFLNLRQPRKPQNVDQWLATPRDVESDIAPNPVAVGNAFDGFVFVEKLTPAKVIWKPSAD